MKNTFSLLFLLLAVFCSGWQAMAQNLEGNGVIKTENRSIGNFSGLNVSGGFEIVLTQGSKEALTVEADENLLPAIITEVRNGNLFIKVKEGGIRNSKRLKVYVTAQNLKNINLAGGIKMYSTNTLKGDALKMDLSGGLNVNLDVQVKELDADISGGSKITLSGHANKASLDLSGAIKLSATALSTDYMTLNASGASNLEVNVVKELKVDTSGIVKVAYKGSPKIQHSGMGKVRPI